jgi:hypothetical protein
LVARPALFAFRVLASRGAPSIPLPGRQQARDLTEARHQDLADLKLLTDFDRSFTGKSAAAFQLGIDDLYHRIDGMSGAAFEMAVSRLVALAGNGHTTVSKAQRAGLYGRVPLRFAWFSDGLYVVRAAPPADRLLGRRVASIDGHSIDQAFAAVRPYLSGTEQRARDDSPPMLESPALLQAIWPDTDGVHLALGLDDATAEQVVALSPAPDAFALQPILAIGPVPDGAAGDGWRSVLDSSAQIPLSLRVPARVAFSAPLDRGGIYVRINANADDERGSLEAQLGDIAATKPPAGWRWMVLDLRFNDGGDERKTLAFTRTLPDLLKNDGTVWVLTGNATFSAAIITAARAKHFLGASAHIVGEIAGDRNPFWSTGGAPLVLRNSGIAISHAYFKQDWVNGCHDVQTCYPGQFLYGVAAGDLTPEIEIGWQFADYAAGRDTLMDKVAELEAARP